MDQKPRVSIYAQYIYRAENRELEEGRAEYTLKKIEAAGKEELRRKQNLVAAIF